MVTKWTRLHNTETGGSEASRNNGRMFVGRGAITSPAPRAQCYGSHDMVREIHLQEYISLKYI